MKKLFIIIIVLMIFGSFFRDDSSNGTKKPEVSQDTPENRLDNARFACREFLKGNLHNPKSADFGDIYGYPAQETAPGEFIVYMTVRAENGFGAIRLTNFTCETALIGPNWHLTSLNQN